MLVKSQVKYIQSLGHKKFRDAEGVFVAEGPKLVGELLQAPNVRPAQLFALSEWIRQQDLKSGHADTQSVIEIKQTELERISFMTTPNQVLGLFKKPAFSSQDLSGKVTLALDDIQDPGNLGTLVRIADWFGIDQIVCSEETTDVFNPKVVQASMGSICRVRVTYQSLEKFFDGHPGVSVYGTTLTGKAVSTMDKIKSGVILIGNESKGIAQELYPYISQQVTIPRAGHAESLNAAVAAGIVISHLVAPARQTT
jgi:TrmH family RNA methyltransferase